MTVRDFIGIISASECPMRSTLRENKLKKKVAGEGEWYYLYQKWVDRS